MEEEKTIVFVVPDKKAPGFARRVDRILQLQEMKAAGKLTRDDWKSLVEFLADYVKADTREHAVDLVWEASEEQWDEMLSALGGAPEVIPPEKSVTSESQEKVTA